ncbi:PREDICTED: RPM1-interacting protein 4 [Camelina sativa]|uniref:RPM1-interacting protein 4 n=1 Tax=Camelina sativa TaxID=90675 RepID=A0ABM0U576_CAMSA|nr:PREDICTED: RPM1-interacting protein 4 [Camelina sativa]
MASSNNQRQQQDRPLPKFGEWDVNDPASAEGFTVIFAKARDDKKTNASGRATSQRRDNNNKSQDEPTKKRFCCF